MLWEVSFANINMLLATIPVYEPETEKKKGGDKVSGGEETSLADIFKE